jgi:hypothetical protein
MLGSLALATVVAGLAFTPALSAQTRDQGGTASTAGDSGGGAVSRGDGGGGAVSRGGDGGGGRVSGGGSATPAPAGNPRTASSPPRNGAGATPRPREDRDQVGKAIPRPDSPGGAGSGGTVIINTGSYYGGYYPWGYGGLGLGGYYGWYDPWYDPYYAGQYYSSAYNGRLRLRIKPSDAEVFVDGYYAGIVDEFDNIFQHLPIETGPHRIEVRRDGYEPLTFEVRILLGRTVTYTGELKRLP